VPRVRRLRREAPALELLAATLPQLRLGLSEAGARTVAYEVFEKLGFGAVAVTDTSQVLAFVGAGADHHGPGDEPIRPVFEALTAQQPLVAPLALRVACRHPACPLGAAAIVPLRLSDGPVGALVAYATDGAPIAEDDVDLLSGLGEQLSAQLQLSELAGSARAAASAELQALQAQIEPHFLFNCLNTIASFTRTDPDRARELILAFADYCRWTLARPGEFIPLEEELRHVRSYLALEQARFGPQLQVTIDATPEALAVPLPPFLVQPLVENAVKHGKGDRPLDLVVRARVRRGRLRVTVWDNGRGIAREALERVLVGEGVRLKSGGFGTVVRLDVPA